MASNKQKKEIKSQHSIQSSNYMVYKDKSGIFKAYRRNDLLYSFVLQGSSIVQQQKYIELALVADNRAVRHTHFCEKLWFLSIK